MILAGPEKEEVPCRGPRPAGWRGKTGPLGLRTEGNPLQHIDLARMNEGEGLPAAHHAWPQVSLYGRTPRMTRRTSRGLAAWRDPRRFSTSGTYINFLSEEKGDEHIHAAYGKNYDGLVGVKTRWDARNLFRMKKNIAPCPSGAERRRRLPAIPNGEEDVMVLDTRALP